MTSPDADSPPTGLLASFFLFLFLLPRFRPLQRGFTVFTTASRRLSWAGHWFYLVFQAGLPGFTGFKWVSPAIPRVDLVNLGFLGFLLDSVLPCIFGFYSGLLGFTGFSLDSIMFDSVLLGFNGLYWVSVGFTGFLLDYVRFCWVLVGLY